MTRVIAMMKKMMIVMVISMLMAMIITMMMMMTMTTMLTSMVMTSDLEKVFLRGDLFPRTFLAPQTSTNLSQPSKTSAPPVFSLLF